jgi:hypothetical protein
MKTLIVAESAGVVAQLKAILAARTGVQTFAYSLLFKALDNLDEINPDWVVISAADFPRHWKLFVRYLRSPVFHRHHDILLVIDNKFDAGEREKARLLGVENYVTENALICGAPPNYDALFRPEPLLLLLQHPLNGCLVSGTVTAVYSDTLHFRPALVPLTAFREGDLIDLATVKAGSRIFPSKFTVRDPRNGAVPLQWAR